jgi:hypothetical protein
MLYNGLKVQVNRSLVRDYFRGLKLLDKSCQIYLSGPSFTIWNISLDKEGIMLIF